MGEPLYSPTNDTTNQTMGEPLVRRQLKGSKRLLLGSSGREEAPTILLESVAPRPLRPSPTNDTTHYGRTPLYRPNYGGASFPYSAFQSRDIARLNVLTIFPPRNRSSLRCHHIFTGNDESNERQRMHPRGKALTQARQRAGFPRAAD